MTRFFRNNPMVSMCVAMIVAAVATNWILNPRSGPFSALTWANSLTVGAVLLIMMAGVALTYVAAIDDPARFTSSKSVGAYFGLTPKKYQSGETDVSGRISKMGDGSVRTALYEAAHVILTRPIKGGALKSWAMKLARRAGMMKAKVALARKLAVVMHRMWIDAIKFDTDKASGCVRVAA